MGWEARPVPGGLPTETRCEDTGSCEWFAGVRALLPGRRARNTCGVGAGCATMVISIIVNGLWMEILTMAHNRNSRLVDRRRGQMLEIIAMLCLAHHSWVNEALRWLVRWCMVRLCQPTVPRRLQKSSRMQAVFWWRSTLAINVLAFFQRSLVL